MIHFPTVLAFLLSGAAASTAELDRSLSILDELEATVISAEYQERALEDVIGELDGQLAVPVRADWEALAGILVDEDDEVTLRLESASATTVLAGVAIQLGDDFERPTFEVYAGQVILTTLAGTEEMRSTDAYDVRDLLAAGGALEELRGREGAGRQTDAAAEAGQREGEAGASRDVGGEAGGEAGGDARGAVNVEELLAGAEEAPPPTPGEELMLLIAEHVDPEAWLELGGGRARISEREGVVLVTASATTHRQFRDVLARLRRMNPRGVAMDAAIVDVPRSVVEELTGRFGPGSAGLARAVMDLAEGKPVWQAVSTVALGEQWTVESARGEIAVTVRLTPRFDRETGLLGMAVEARSVEGADRRSVRTTAALQAKGGAVVVELPSATAGARARVLVVIPRRF